MPPLLHFPFSFPQTLASLPAPSVLKWAFYVAHFSQGGLFDLSAFPTWNRPCCGGLYVCVTAWARPPRWAATFQSYRAPAAILARLQRMTGDGGGASTGGCVQRSRLPPCRVPRCASFHGHHVFFFFFPYFSFVHSGWISMWCKCSYDEGLE